jgi:hypothetical protein
MNHRHSSSPRANLLVALLLGMMLSLAPQSGALNSGPEGSLDASSAPLSGPLMYSQSRYSLFFGARHEAATIGRQHFTGETASPYQPINGNYPRLLRYRGADKQR